MQGTSPGIRIRRETTVFKQEKTLDFATLFLAFFDDEELFFLLHDINEAKQNTFLKRNKKLFNAVKYFFENGGQRLYVLNFSTTKKLNYTLVHPFLQDYCDTLSDLETICSVGLIDGLLSEDKISLDEALKVLYSVNSYASQTDRISISDINETIKDNFLDRLDETVIYYPWFLGENGESFPPSIIASALASKLAFEGKFFHSIANKEIYRAQALTQTLSKLQIEELNKEDINPIIDVHTKGLRIWGVKAFNSKYESVNEMRVLKYVKRSLKRISRPYLFEANTEQLHDRLYTKIYHFLYLLWESGALSGANQEDAFRVGSSNQDLDAERNSLVFEILIAISRPLEFIVITLNRIENNGAQESLSLES